MSHRTSKNILTHEFDPELPPGFLNMDKVLFLDFDGVLHPEGSLDNELLFCFSANFVDLIEEMDPSGEVPIVITSAWRLDTDLEGLRSHFRESIRRQIVGVTIESKAQMILGWDPDIRTGPQPDDGQREYEIKRWMKDFSPAGEWLAIDDRANLFSKDCPNLFLIPDVYEDIGGGLNTYQCSLLKDRLSTFLDKAKPSKGARP